MIFTARLAPDDFSLASITEPKAPSPSMCSNSYTCRGSTPRRDAASSRENAWQNSLCVRHISCQNTSSKYSRVSARPATCSNWRPRAQTAPHTPSFSSSSAPTVYMSSSRMTMALGAAHLKWHRLSCNAVTGRAWRPKTLCDSSSRRPSRSTDQTQSSCAWDGFVNGRNRVLWSCNSMSMFAFTSSSTALVSSSTKTMVTGIQHFLEVL
mmetsp:Transcript_42356/g.119780  ORF Transcript_42356/g.119780 Transcript_42356/m.119780 type:complete len:209 (+) Transcript_42356:493-1119(+)